MYFGLVTSSMVPAFIAVVTFSALDGRGYYAHLEKWAFDDRRVLKRFYLYFLGIVTLQAVGVLAFYDPL